MGPKVLVIDDDEVVLVAIADLLEEAGMQVETMGSPIGATQVILQKAIDLVIIDINMPLMRGDKVVQLLRGWERTRELPVIIISGLEQGDLAQVRKAIPDVAVVRKVDMDKNLVSVVRFAATSRGSKPAAAPQPASDEGAFVADFAHEIAMSMPRLREAARQIAAGDDTDRESVCRLMDRSADRAQLLGFGSVSTLLGAFGSFIRSAQLGAPLGQGVESALIEASMELASLPRTPANEVDARYRSVATSFRTQVA